MICNANGLKVEQVAIPPLDSLEIEWRELQTRAEHSFFMSWEWIGAWLESLPASVVRSLVRLRANGRVVGLTIVCKRTIRRGGLIVSHGLYINCTGDPELDELTIEYNDFLIETGLERQGFQVILQFLLRDSTWDELFLNGWRQPLSAVDSHEEFGLCVVRRTIRPCHEVDLDRLGKSGSTYVDTLPPRVRYKVKRTLREAARLGPVRIDMARTPEESTRFLEELKRLHQKSWMQRGKAGSFANGYFDGFHATMVARTSAEGVVQLLRILIGDVPVGYIYNFVYSGHVYNYQSGFDFDFGRGANWRPGILSHVKSIEFNMMTGMRVYDFLAGDQLHKRELGNDANNLIWATLQRPRFKFRVERQLRALRNSMPWLR